MTERMHPEDLERLADLIAERLRPAAEPELVDTGTVARRLGVSADWVREHAEELGVVRLGMGPRPRLRFDVSRAVAAYQARTSREDSRGSQVAGSRVSAGPARVRREVVQRASAQRVAVPAWDD